MFEVTTLSVPNPDSTKPDTLGIFFWHFSLGENWLGKPQIDPYAKIYVECTLAVNESWPINWYDYRSNSTTASATAGLRTDVRDCGTTTEEMGIRPPFHFDEITSWNLGFDHLDSFWTLNIALDTTAKNRILLDYDAPDTTANPDTTFAPMSTDLVWWEGCTLEYDDLPDDAAFETAKERITRFRDSTTNYPNHFFIFNLASGLPYAYNQGLGGDSMYGTHLTIDIAYMDSLDIWARDTLVDTTKFPNFRVWSWYRAMNEWSHDLSNICFYDTTIAGTTYTWFTDSTICPGADTANCDSCWAEVDNYGCLRWSLIKTNSIHDLHPSTYGSQVNQDTALVYLEDLITGRLSTYWSAEDGDTTINSFIMGRGTSGNGATQFIIGR
jgi:hypothetical protein